MMAVRRYTPVVAGESQDLIQVLINSIKTLITSIKALVDLGKALINSIETLINSIEALIKGIKALVDLGKSHVELVGKVVNRLHNISWCVCSEGVLLHENARKIRRKMSSENVNVPHTCSFHSIGPQFSLLHNCCCDSIVNAKV